MAIVLPAEPPAIRTPHLLLRPAREEDAGPVLRFYTDNRDFLEVWEPRKGKEFYTDDFWRRQARINERDRVEDRALRLFLFDGDDETRVVGTANFTQIFRGAFHACYLGYSLARDAEGRGLMREALGAAIPYVFDELHLHRVMANYLPHNRRSAAVLRALGFTVEGYARDYLMINGRWEDHILTSLTNPRWTPPARAE